MVIIGAMWLLGPISHIGHISPIRATVQICGAGFEDEDDDEDENEAPGEDD